MAARLIVTKNDLIQARKVVQGVLNNDNSESKPSDICRAAAILVQLKALELKQQAHDAKMREAAEKQKARHVSPLAVGRSTSKGSSPRLCRRVTYLRIVG